MISITIGSLSNKAFAIIALKYGYFYDATYVGRQRDVTALGTWTVPDISKDLFMC